MCNLHSITTNQEAIRALFRVINRYVGNLSPMPGVFPNYPAPVVRTLAVSASLHASAVTPGRWIFGNEHPQHVINALAGLARLGKPLLRSRPSVGNQTQGSAFSLIEPGSTALPTVCRMLWFGLGRTDRNRGLQDQKLTVTILEAHDGWLQK
jgi:hypothetical protein